MSSTTTVRNLVTRPNALYDEIAKSHPSLLGGRVWCTRCNSFRHVNAGGALRSGWSQCCGRTVKVDSPEERKAKP